MWGIKDQAVSQHSLGRDLDPASAGGSKEWASVDALRSLVLANCLRVPAGKPYGLMEGIKRMQTEHIYKRMGAPKKMDNHLPQIGKTEEEKCQLKLQAHVESPVNRVWSARGWWFWVEPNYQGGHKTSNSVRIRNRPSKFRVVLDSEFQIQVLEAFPFDETLFQHFTKLLTNNILITTDFPLTPRISGIVQHALRRRLKLTRTL